MTRVDPGLPSRRLVLLIAGLTLIRLVVAAVSGLADDEVYYRLWSLDLRGGYFDHAPMIAWFIRAGRVIAGDGALGIRLLGPLSTFLGSLLLWRTVAIADGRDAGDRAALWFNAALLIGAGSIVATPDLPSVLFWGTTLWALAELARSGNPRWWIAVGIAAGLGLASKYSVLFLGIGILLWLAGTRDGRRWFLSPWLWVGGLIAAALFAPVVLWNADHGWVSFAKQFGRTVPHGFRPEKLAEFLGVQWALIGLTLTPLAILGVVGAIRRWRAGDALAALPLATSAPFALYLLFHSLHGGVEGNWPAPLYSAIAWLAATLPLDGSRFRTTCARIVAPLGYGLAALLYLHVCLPVLILTPEQDPTAQMRGWDGFVAEVKAKADAVGAAWIAVPNYGLVARFAYGLGSGSVRELGEPERWANLPPLDPAPTDRPALFVTRTRRDPAERLLPGRFEKIERLGTIDRRSGGRVVDSYAIYRVEGPIGDPLR